jgi:hypothetical protein
MIISRREPWRRRRRVLAGLMGVGGDRLGGLGYLLGMDESERIFFIAVSRGCARTCPSYVFQRP